MAETTVYACDWCDHIVEKDRNGEPKYAAKVVAKLINTALPRDPYRYQICARCWQAFRALTEGKYRR